MEKKRKILLISPVSMPLSSEIFAFPPLSLLQVAALTPNHYKIELFDENVETERIEERDLNEVDLVGLSVMTPEAPRAYTLADGLRRKGKKVVLGGIHPTALPKEAIQHADAVVIGEAEGIWQKVLEDFERKTLKKFYKGERFPSLSKLPIPRRDLLKKELYTLPNTIQVSRGCPFNCSFCSVSRFFGNRYRFRPIPEVVAEIEEMIKNDNIHPVRRFLSNIIWEKFSQPVIVFVDDNISGNKRYARELFRALIQLRIYWGGQASINIARPENEELLKLAAESGCKLLFIGFESISLQGLKEAHKRINKPQEYTQAIKLFHKYGIGVLGAFIFGFDSDDKSVFEETLRFTQEVKLDGAQFTILTPPPGTELMEKLEKENRTINKNWQCYDFTTSVFQPEKITQKELEAGRKWALQKFYSKRSILQRIPLDYRRLIVYFPLNYGYRKQIDH